MIFVYSLAIFVTITIIIIIIIIIINIISALHVISHTPTTFRVTNELKMMHESFGHILGYSKKRVIEMCVTLVWTLRFLAKAMQV